MAATEYPMTADLVLGDGGNLTVYERPDGSRYALDKKGHGQEWEDGLIFGRARFDARALSSGRWPGSRSTPQRIEPEVERTRRSRRHSLG